MQFMHNYRVERTDIRPMRTDMRPDSLQRMVSPRWHGRCGRSRLSSGGVWTRSATAAAVLLAVLLGILGTPARAQAPSRKGSVRRGFTKIEVARYLGYATKRVKRGSGEIWYYGKTRLIFRYGELQQYKPHRDSPLPQVDADSFRKKAYMPPPRVVKENRKTTRRRVKRRAKAQKDAAAAERQRQARAAEARRRAKIDDADRDRARYGKPQTEVETRDIVSLTDWLTLTWVKDGVQRTITYRRFLGNPPYRRLRTTTVTVNSQ